MEVYTAEWDSHVSMERGDTVIHLSMGDRERLAAYLALAQGALSVAFGNMDATWKTENGFDLGETLRKALSHDPDRLSDT